MYKSNAFAKIALEREYHLKIGKIKAYTKQLTHLKEMLDYLVFGGRTEDI